MKRRQLWQVKPKRCRDPEASRIRGRLPAGLGLLHAERLAPGDDHDAVVKQPVEQADGGGVLGEEAAPILEGPVAGDAEGTALVGSGDEAEEQLRPGVIERGESQLVND